MRPAKYSREPKPCAYCGTLFFIRIHETPGHFRLRKSCSPVCAGRLKGIPKIKPTPPKQCVICGNEIVMRPDERKTAAYRKRSTCSPSCKGQLSVRNRPADGNKGGKTRTDTGQRVCVICNQSFERRHTEKPNEFRNRETCSPPCANKLSGNRQRKELPERYCQWCGVRLELGVSEHPNQFLVRLTCGNECGMRISWETRRKNRPYAERQYALDWDAISIVIKDRDRWTCQECGKLVEGGDAQAHHIDYDKMHNDHANLITLCTSCHAKTNFRRDHWQRHFESRMKR